MKTIWEFGYPIIAIFGAYAVYAIIIKPRMDEAYQVLGKAHELNTKSGLAWVWAKIDGWKTQILTAIVAAFQVLQLLPAETITEIQQLPWGGLFEANVANKISLVCAFLITITHVTGIVKAAKTVPQPPQA